ncbi:MAG: tetratricopeptide repeat protein [Planctomycetia bacterium]|nr:tetratricopeptide repeat protein [Planctomycetia bacterium]
MKRILAGAGLFWGLALVVSAQGDAGEAPGDRMDPEFAPDELEDGALSFAALDAARRLLAEGDVEGASAALKGAFEAAGRTRAVMALADAVGWQNLEFQLRAPAESRAAAVLPLPEGDRLYLQARASPDAARFRDADAKTPQGHLAARRALATIAADEGRWDEARAAFEAILRTAPNDAETRARFAFAAYYRRDLDLALDQFGAALDADPRCAEAWYGTGAVWLGRGLFESAGKALRRAVALDPIHWKAREALVQALAGEGKLAEADGLRARLRELARKLPRIPDRITVAVLPREGGAVVVRESLRDGVPWVFRMETFDQARPGGTPIKTMELRRDGTAFAWGEAAEDGSFRAMKPVAALPDLGQVLEEAK